MIPVRPQMLLPDNVLSIYCLKGELTISDLDIAGFIGNWEDDGYCFLFFRQPADEAVERLLGKHPGLILEDQFTMTYRQWQGGFEGPLKIGRFILSPPLLKKVAQGDEIGLKFDPGLVFGNGTHPTTLACLTAIEIACAGGKVERMLDLGTGTGLLALAGASLGCRQVLAIDNNMLAAVTASQNIRINNLQQRVLAVNGLAQTFVDLPSDLLVANIGYPVLKELLTAESVRHHHWLVLSGLQTSEVENILKFLEKLNVVVLKHWHSETVWNTLLAITAA
ncbi:MAG: methyltransferase [Desulfofustis sp.]|nr:methyltransferase [Desulfofustis sp.]